MLGSPGMETLNGAEMKYPSDCYSPKHGMFADPREYRGICLNIAN